MHLKMHFTPPPEIKYKYIICKLKKEQKKITGKKKERKKKQI